MSTARRLSAFCLAVAADVRAAVRHHDLTLMSAGTTFYLAIAGVPMVLVAIRLATVLTSRDRVLRLGLEVAGHLPPGLGADRAARNLVTAGSGLTPLQGLLSLIPASLYGEGLRRAFVRLSPRTASGVRTAWQGRVIALALLCVSPVLTVGVLLAVAGITTVIGDGVGGVVLGVYLAFLAAWVLVSCTLVLQYRGLGPDRPGLRALLLGAFTAGSFVAGFLLGFLLFLTIPVRVGQAYGGFDVAAAAAVAGGWAMLLHALVLVGYALTLCLDARLRAGSDPAGGSVSWSPPARPEPSPLQPSPPDESRTEAPA